jgi:hypothetical protein
MQHLTQDGKYRLQCKTVQNESLLRRKDYLYFKNV